MLHPFSPSWRDEAGVNWKSAQGAWLWLWSKAQDCASPVAMVEAIFCLFEDTKSPLVFVSFSVDIKTILQDLLSSGTSDTLQIPTDIYSLPHRPWEMNCFSLEENPNLTISCAHPVGIFFPFPCQWLWQVLFLTISECDKSILTSLADISHLLLSQPLYTVHKNLPKSFCFFPHGPTLY